MFPNMGPEAIACIQLSTLVFLFLLCLAILLYMLNWHLKRRMILKQRCKRRMRLLQLTNRAALAARSSPDSISIISDRVTEYLEKVPSYEEATIAANLS